MSWTRLLPRQFFARQLRKPSGWWGKFVMTRLLNAGNTIMNGLIFEQLNAKGGKIGASDRILEVGFGGGYLLEQILSLNVAELVVGIDFSPEIVDYCQKRFPEAIAAKKLELQCTSVDNIPYPDGYFTKIATVNTLYFWPNVQQTLTELKRVLASQGYLFICFTPPDFLERSGLTQQGFQAYEVDEIKTHLETAGFANIDWVSQSDRLHDEFLCISGQKP